MTGIYLLGGAQTDFARNWAREGLDVYAMFRETLESAVQDAAIDPARIEVGHVGNFVGDLFCGQGLINGFFGHVYPELADLPTSRHEAACASGSIAMLSAMRDIEAGHYGVAAVLGLFGDHARKSAGGSLLMSSTKGVHGHALGASGAIEMIACLHAVRDGVIAPTANLENPDESFDIDLVAREARERPARIAMNNTFGFGGHNTTLILKRFEG